MSKLIDSFLDRLLAKTGGWYIFIVVAISQLIGFPGALLGALSIQMNAEFNDQQIRSLTALIPILLILTDLILLAIALFISNTARRQLNSIYKSRKTTDSDEEQKTSWKQITAFTWRYGISSAVLAYVIIVIGNTGYHYYVANTTYDQVVYSLMGGAVAVITTVLLATLLLERMLVPARLALLPKEFEAQLVGRAGPLLNVKFQSLVALLILSGILIIGPIGYHQTVKVLYEEVGSQQVLIDLQFQSISVSLIILVLGLGLSLIISRSISDPVKNLIDTFSKVEQGDLSQRATIMASDEIAELSIYFNRMVSQLEELQGSLEKQVRDRTAQLSAISKVGSAASSILDPDEIVAEVVGLITKELGYYFAAIYLVDSSNQWAVLKEATGDAGGVLKGTNHRVEITNINIIGKAIRTRQAQISLDVGEMAVQFDNPILPYTRSEIALPLYVGDQTLGALDVHSSNESAFNELDIETLQNMANQVAISLDNARLFQETRQRLSEMRNIQKQYLREAWIDTNLPQGGTSFVQGDNSETNEENLIEVPIALRDQIIGQLTIEGQEALSAEDKNWIQAVATQAALALENARLLDESQSAAMREKFVTEITNKIWASTSIDGVLQTAVRELGQILDATEATIEINVD